MRVKRHSTGSVRYDKRRKTWNFLWYEGATRRSKRIGTKQEYPTKAAAWKAHNAALVQPPAPTGETVLTIALRYQVERMPSRKSTSRVYLSFLKNHILPRWGTTTIQEVQPRPVELWLRNLLLSPKTKTHVRSLLHSLLEFAMWSGDLEIARNPITLVQNKGATKRTRRPRSLTVEHFRLFLSQLREPFATIALVCVCFGLRISEALALRWGDVDWLRSRIKVERGIVNQNVDAVKTEGSESAFEASAELLDRLRIVRQMSHFPDPDDWMFASVVQIGRLPYAYTTVWREFRRAALAAGLEVFGTHTLRHTFRSWLDAAGTKLSVQQKLMRHSDIRTTMNTYGDVVTDEMSTASQQVNALAFPANGAQTERKPS